MNSRFVSNFIAIVLTRSLTWIRGPCIGIFSPTIFSPFVAWTLIVTVMFILRFTLVNDHLLDFEKKL